MTTVQSARQQSLDLARSAVSLAVARLSEKSDFGTQPDTPILEVPGGSPRDRGMVVFDQVQARQIGSSLFLKQPGRNGGPSRLP